MLESWKMILKCKNNNLSKLVEKRRLSNVLVKFLNITHSFYTIDRKQLAELLLQFHLKVKHRSTRTLPPTQSLFVAMAMANSSLLSFLSARRRMMPSGVILLIAGVLLVVCSTGGLAARLDSLDGQFAHLDVSF